MFCKLLNMRNTFYDILFLRLQKQEIISCIIRILPISIDNLSVKIYCHLFIYSNTAKKFYLLYVTAHKESLQLKHGADGS